jgi:hypothetical protein
VDSNDQFAGLGLSRDQSNRAGLGRVDGGIPHIEAQVAFPREVVWTVALEAVLGQNGSDCGVEIGAGRRASGQIEA